MPRSSLLSICKAFQSYNFTKTSKTLQTFHGNLPERENGRAGKKEEINCQLVKIILIMLILFLLHHSPCAVCLHHISMEKIYTKGVPPPDKRGKIVQIYTLSIYYHVLMLCSFMMNGVTSVPGRIKKPLQHCNLDELSSSALINACNIKSKSKSKISVNYKTFQEHLTFENELRRSKL